MALIGGILEQNKCAGESQPSRWLTVSSNRPQCGDFLQVISDLKKTAMTSYYMAFIAKSKIFLRKMGV
ncbi:hypothetical protein [Tyzzerella sp. An114]|uniref:hypothetical protein n=1 Tax=Tyzzerella sp. An114 TaxID=1965545 RepID=UPI00117EFC74|nr:hypothetical protein [Tyzzerella sp. An114]